MDDDRAELLRRVYGRGGDLGESAEARRLLDGTTEEEVEPGVPGERPDRSRPEREVLEGAAAASATPVVLRRSRGRIVAALVGVIAVSAALGSAGTLVAQRLGGVTLHEDPDASTDQLPNGAPTGVTETKFFDPYVGMTVATIRTRSEHCVYVWQNLAYYPDAASTGCASGGLEPSVDVVVNPEPTGPYQPGDATDPWNRTAIATLGAGTVLRFTVDGSAVRVERGPDRARVDP